MGYNMVGLDPSPKLLKDAGIKARGKNLTVEFRRGDAENLPFEDDSFDHTIAMAVFQYVPNPLKAVKEFVRVTRPGGMVIIDISNRYNIYRLGLGRIAHFLMPRFFPDFSNYCSLYDCAYKHKKSSRSEMKGLFKSAGLTEIEIKPILFVWHTLPDWLFNIAKVVEFSLYKLPFMREFLAVLVCKGIVPKNKL